MFAMPTLLRIKGGGSLNTKIHNNIFIRILFYVDSTQYKKKCPERPAKFLFWELGGWKPGALQLQRYECSGADATSGLHAYTFNTKQGQAEGNA
jgi:hypothetical protein